MCITCIRTLHLQWHWQWPWQWQWHWHTYMHACMHACIHTYIHTYIHAYIHPYIHTYSGISLTNLIRYLLLKMLGKSQCDWFIIIFPHEIPHGEVHHNAHECLVSLQQWMGLNQTIKLQNVLKHVPTTTQFWVNWDEPWLGTGIV